MDRGQPFPHRDLSVPRFLLHNSRRGVNDTFPAASTESGLRAVLGREVSGFLDSIHGPCRPGSAVRGVHHAGGGLIGCTRGRS
jgi:hypothetical protein